MLPGVASDGLGYLTEFVGVCDARFLDALQGAGPAVALPLALEDRREAALAEQTTHLDVVHHLGIVLVEVTGYYPYKHLDAEVRRRQICKDALSLQDLLRPQQLVV